MMGVGGLAGRMALLREQMKKTPCERCGLHYDHEKNDQCPYCGDLDAQGLLRLREKQERAWLANREMGFWFILAAVVLLALLIAM